MVSSVMGQCDFPDYDSYGLVCDEARFLCGYEMDGYTGRLLEQDSPKPQPHPLCSGQGGADNIQWFSFVADDVNIEIVLSYSNCTGHGNEDPGLQVGILSSCELDASGRPVDDIFCLEGTNYTDIVFTPDPQDIEVGQLYLLFIDGWYNSVCDFEIDVVRGVCTDIPDTTQVCEQDCGVISSESGTLGSTFFQDTFSFNSSSLIIADVFGCNPMVNNTRLDSIICVEWDIQPNVGFNIISSSFEFYDSIEVVPTLIVEWTLPGTYTIEPILTFNPLFSNCQGMCDCTEDVVFTVEVTESVISQLTDIELCPGECIDFCGQTYCQTGVYECYDRDQSLIEIQAIVQRPNVEIDEGLVFFCPGECFEYQDIMYCDADSYSISESAFCDTTYLFQLEELDFSVNLVRADDLISCTVQQALMEGSWNTNFNGNVLSAWISEVGDTIAFGSEFTTTEGGNYTFVAWPEGMKSCESSISHTVNKDADVPTASLNPPFLDCNNPSDNITINTRDAIMSVAWSGPDGFVSSDINANVSQVGRYEVTITTTNGCILKVQTDVLGDFESPIVEVIHSNFTCLEDTPTAYFLPMSNTVSHQWNLPDASNSSIDVLDLNNIGNYSLEVTASNGCTAEENFTVLDLSYDPSLLLNEDRVWRCLDTAIPLDLSAQEVQGLRYIWTDEKEDVISNTINLTMPSPGVYTLTIIDDEVGCVGYDTVRIVEDPNPFIDVEFAMLAPLCDGGNDGLVEVMGIEGGTGPYIYEIDGEEFSDLADRDFEAGKYEVNVIDAFGCMVSKEIEVPAALPFVLEVEPELSVRFGQTKTISFETSLDDSEVALIEWTNDDGDILGIDRTLSVIGEQMDFIYLRVENQDGCAVTAEVKIDLSFEVDIYFPNVFSPNNDGTNDLFILYNNGFPELADELKIFDRSGELIYISDHTEFNETKDGWDGTFNGKPCQPGVYVFVLQYTLMNGTPQTISGSITLIR